MPEPQTVHLWRCTHDLCTRVVQDRDVDWLRLSARLGHGYEQEHGTHGTRLLIDKPDSPPKCIGSHRSDGGYTSHRATPMELVEYAPVPVVALDDQHEATETKPIQGDQHA